MKGEGSSNRFVVETNSHFLITTEKQETSKNQKMLDINLTFNFTNQISNLNKEIPLGVVFYFSIFILFKFNIFLSFLFQGGERGGWRSLSNMKIQTLTNTALMRFEEQRFATRILQVIFTNPSHSLVIGLIIHQDTVGYIYQSIPLSRNRFNLTLGYCRLYSPIHPTLQKQV